MPSTLKRPSIGRLLASLRPSRGGTSPSSFPVQTGFPTSLADLVVKNHGRLRKPRKPRVLASAPTSAPVEVDDELTPPSPPPPAQPPSPVVVQRPDSAPRQEGGAVFRLRPEVLAFGGAVALALLAVWSEGTVAAFTVAALSLLWIESASRRRGPRCSAEAEALLDSRGRGTVSPIRAVVEAPRSSDSCSDSDKGDELVAAAGDGGGSEDPTTPRLKAKRSLKKLISNKLQKKSKSKDSCDGEANQPGTAAGDTADPATLKTESLVPFSTEQTPSESSMEWSSSWSESVEEGRGIVKFPLAALAPVILAGLVVGKLPATALAVLCIVFSSAVQRRSSDCNS